MCIYRSNDLFASLLLDSNKELRSIPPAAGPVAMASSKPELLDSPRPLNSIGAHGEVALASTSRRGGIMGNGLLECLTEMMGGQVPGGLFIGGVIMGGRK